MLKRCIGYVPKKSDFVWDIKILFKNGMTYEIF
jgi:hypothetical protein